MTTRAKTNLISKIAAALVVAFLLSLVPLGLQNSGQLYRSEAYADLYNSDWEELIDIYAEAAGMAPAEMVASAGAVGMVRTGINISNAVGFSAAGTLSDNLAGFIDAASFQDWNSLPQEERDQWGTKEHYDAAKFVSFLSIFGLKDSNDQFAGSGGSGFTLSDDAQNILEALGRVGRAWTQRASVAYSDIAALIFDEKQFMQFFEVPYTLSYDGTEQESWPSGFPRNVNVGYGTVFQYLNTNPAACKTLASSREIYWLIFEPNPTISATDVYMFDKQSFNWGSASSATIPNMGRSSGTAGFSGLSFQSAAWSSSTGTDKATGCNMPVNSLGMNSWPSGMSNSVGIIEAAILKEGTKTEYETDLVDYPTGDVQPETPVYMPANINENTNWPTFEEEPQEPVTPRPDTPYNPDNQTGGDQWRDETTQNLLPLTGIRFDNLFPFSMLSDIPKLFNKVKQLAPGTDGDYSKITIPVWLPGDDTNLVLDLKPLHDLLLMTRPVVLAFLIAALLWATVKFWQSILTG